MKKLLPIILFIIQSIAVTAQKEANIWHFGFLSGLDFNDTLPVPIKGSLNTQEGSSSIADKNGQLLFYTDGVTVWNKNHKPMPNGTGLLGFSSSTQSALIVRKPGSSSIYFLFTADGTSNALNHHMENGYRFSIVDMNLAGGLGDVTAVKNRLLYAPSTEKLAAVKQADGVNIWLMTHEWNSSKFRAYSINCNGIDTNAVISDIGDSHNYNPGLYYEVIGQMKFSPDGKKLAVVNQGKARVQIFDFDNLSGTLSNPVNVLSYWTDQYKQPDGSVFDLEDLYGVEFSPNSKLLYLTCIGGQKLFQYDLSPNTSIGISATGIYYYLNPWCVGNNGTYYCPGVNGGLQLGPDGKIYIAYKSYTGLSVINNPNIYGKGFDYVRSDTLINPSTYGLPSFLASYFDEGVLQLVDQKCKTITVRTKLATGNSCHWDFGDPDSITDVSTIQNPSYTYSKSGQYTIKLIQTSSVGCSDTLRLTVKIKSCDTTEIIHKIPIDIPNVFTPNGDGVNDVFLIKGLDQYADNEVTIFDRWGIERFNKMGYSVDNAFAGDNCNDGVYYYTIVIPSINWNQHGHITLIR